MDKGGKRGAPDPHGAQMGKNPQCLGSVQCGFYDYQGSVWFLSSL